uniref:RING-type domain-containing protein n=1 Tax=Tetradesmus obliquus TaxID=3088 RepID=A0A383VCQ1_TETOB|eukprot:jgi/Sobl393_1/12853/SZX63338.1
MWEGLPRGSSPLHLAARKNDNALALQLLRAYAKQWQHRGHPDPRLLEDRTHCLPYQLALRHNNAALAECLDPTTPLASLFGDAATQQLPASVLLGPASLAQLARAALHRKLESELKSLQDQAEAAPVSLSQKAVLQPVMMIVAEGEAADAAVSDASAVLCCATSEVLCCASSKMLTGADVTTAACKSEDATAAGDDAQDEETDDDGEPCGVCLDAAPAVCLQPCKHRICADCCATMLAAQSRCVLVCPFCRGGVGALGP